MDEIANLQGIEMIGFTYQVNLPRLEETIRETAEDGEPMENFIRGRLEICDGIYKGDYNRNRFPTFFIYRYDPEREEFWLSNGNIVQRHNLSLLISCGIISEPVHDPENEFIATEFLQKRESAINQLPDVLQETIIKLRHLTESLHKIPVHFGWA
jgi:hypothetical protein